LAEIENKKEAKMQKMMDDGAAIAAKQ